VQYYDVNKTEKKRKI